MGQLRTPVLNYEVYYVIFAMLIISVYSQQLYSIMQSSGSEAVSSPGLYIIPLTSYFFLGEIV